MAADRLTSTPGGPYFTNNALDAEILSQALASVPASHDSGPMTLTIPVGTPSSASETPVISSGGEAPSLDTDIFYSGVNDGHEVVSNYPLGWEANSLGYGFG
ncbi:hypothetical protein OQA88_4298 [Cercophora sp. LCS_1]